MIFQIHDHVHDVNPYGKVLTYIASEYRRPYEFSSKKRAKRYR